jgi:serum/glucocorticoid-regulated kinase 2
LTTVIGKGSFGKVMQVRKRDTQRIYALKTIRKAHIVDRGEITHTLAERLVLSRVMSPFIVPLKFSFQSEQKLYLILASVSFLSFLHPLTRSYRFVNGGELFHHLQREQKFNEERSRFYSAELLLALEHLHDLDVVYRYALHLIYIVLITHAGAAISSQKTSFSITQATLPFAILGCVNST